MKYPVLLFFIFSLLPSAAWAQTSAGNWVNPVRSFDELFPGFGESKKRDVFGADGFIHSLENKESPELVPAPYSGIDIYNIVMRNNPSYLAESLLVIPYQNREWDRLDAFNALGKVRDLKGRLYHSHTRNSEIPLFEDATRLESDKKTNPVPDPAPAKELPLSDTVYIRLKDVNFGNSYYRGDVSISQYGVTYKLSNFKNLTYLLFPVIKEEKFSAILYMEPLVEGMLIYSVTGADASDFISNRIDIPSAIEKRLAVFIGWISDGLKSL